jgi:hypothetical protein
MKYREIWHELQLAGWRTTDTRGQSAVGKTLEFWLNGHLDAEMVVTELKADALVQWRVTDRGIRETGRRRPHPHTTCRSTLRRQR